MTTPPTLNFAAFFADGNTGAEVESKNDEGRNARDADAGPKKSFCQFRGEKYGLAHRSRSAESQTFDHPLGAIVGKQMHEIPKGAGPTRRRHAPKSLK
jgi:hypothetical protein